MPGQPSLLPLPSINRLRHYIVGHRCIAWLMHIVRVVVQQIVNDLKIRESEKKIEQTTRFNAAEYVVHGGQYEPCCILQFKHVLCK